jgi:hypothetical protein
MLLNEIKKCSADYDLYAINLQVRVDELLHHFTFLNHLDILTNELINFSINLALTKAPFISQTSFSDRDLAVHSLRVSRSLDALL